MDQAELPMLEVLEFYQGRPSVFHIPGHGAQAPHPSLQEFAGMFAADQTTPSLLAQAGVVAPGPEARAQQLAAELWGAARCWWLFGGASQGNHAMLLGLTGPRDLVLAARGSHLSLVSGLVLSGADVHWTGNSWDKDWEVLLPLQPEDLEQALETLPRRPRAVIVTSPSYFGQVADIEALAEICHRHEMPLWVDGSWGSHFGFHPDLPQSPLRQGADLLLLSTHKHAGSLRGSALLLAADSPWVGEQQLNDLQQAVQVLASTSPSPLMRLSLDAARWQLANRGASLWGPVLAMAERARRDLAGQAGLHVLDAKSKSDGQDRTRLVLDVSPSGWNAMQLSQRLIVEHGVLPELATDRLLVLMCNHGTSLADIERLVSALAVELPNPEPAPPLLGRLPAPGAPVISARAAALGARESLPLDQSAGRLAAEAVAVYPPGIPALLPGCTISEEMVEYLQRAREFGARLHGALDPQLQRVQVVA